MVVPLPVQPVTLPVAVLFGKLPSHGDFVCRGLDAQSREAVDGWLSRSVAQGVEALASRFAEAHDAAPVWRFLTRDGGWGSGWKAGAVAPSVDRAGRRFFVLLAVDGLSSRDAAARGRALAMAMEARIYEAFSQGWDADSLQEAAAFDSEAVGIGAAVSSEAAEAWWVVDADGQPALERDSRPADLIPGVQSISMTESSV